MNMFEEARAMRTMIDMRSLTQSELARRMGVSQSYVANKLRLLGFSDELQALILKCGLSERHARAVLKLKDEGSRADIIEKIRTMRLSVAAAEVLIDNAIVDEMPKTLANFCARDRLERFEEIISETAKSLKSYGYKVRKKTDRLGNKRYITVYIEE